MRNSIPFEVHVHEDFVAQSHKPPDVQISVNLRILCPEPIDYVVSLELSFILEESIGYEDWNIVLPFITGRSR